MWTDEAILKKRPVNATQRLDQRSRVLFLALKDVLACFEEGGPVLLGCVCELPEMVAPLLRAARDGDSVLVLSPGGELAESRSLHRFFELIRSTAELIGTSRPIVLLPPPVALRPAEPELASERVHALVDAGYTGLSITVDEIDPTESPAAIAGVAEAAVERELGLEILLQPGDEDEGGAVAGALKILGAEPDLVGVLGGGGVGIAALASEVEPLGTSWREGEDEDEVREALRNSIGAGARMVTVRSIFSRVVSESLAVMRPSPASSDGAEDHDVRDLLDGLAEEELDRIEARLYAETDELLSVLRLAGSGRWIKDRLGA